MKFGRIRKGVIVTNNEIGVIIDKMKELNTELMDGVEKNLQSSQYYSSMPVHTRILKETMVIKLLLEL